MNETGIWRIGLALLMLAVFSALNYPFFSLVLLERMSQGLIDDLKTARAFEIPSHIGKLSYHVEFFSAVSTQRGARWVGAVDSWLTYDINKNLRLDGGAFSGGAKAAIDLHLWLGMTWRY